MRDMMRLSHQQIMHSDKRQYAQSSRQAALEVAVAQLHFAMTTMSAKGLEALEADAQPESALSSMPMDNQGSSTSLRRPWLTRRSTAHDQSEDLAVRRDAISVT